MLENQLEPPAWTGVPGSPCCPWVRFVAVDTGNLNMLDTHMSRDIRTTLMGAGYDRMQSLLAEMAHDEPMTSIDF